MSVPLTRRGEDADEYDSILVADPYRWLEQLDAPEVASWVEAQARHTAAFLAEEPRRARIEEELARYTDLERRSPPVHKAGRWFQLRNDGMQQQDDLWVGDAGGERLLIAAESATTAFTSLQPSPDAQRLAYSVSVGGSDWSELRVHDVGRGSDLEDRLNWVKSPGTSWLPDGESFLYAGFEAPEDGKQHIAASTKQQVRLHRLGTSQLDDPVVFEAEGMSFLVPHVSADGQHIAVELMRGAVPTGIVVRRVESADAFEHVVDGPDLVRYVGMRDGVVFVQSHAGAPNGEVVAIEVSTGHRRVLVAERAEPLSSAFGGAFFFGSSIITVYRGRDGSSMLVTPLDGESYVVDLPAHQVVGPLLTGQPEDPVFSFTTTSLITPSSVWSHDVVSRTSSLSFAPDLGVDSSRYLTETVEVASADGTLVPMTVFRRSDLLPDGQRPTMMAGYGGFGINFSFMGFLPWVLPWLEHGGVICAMGLRGGGEYGEAWHEAGMRENKQNVFDDAIACTEWCIAQGWTQSERIALMGASNGGLLAGALVTQRPDLFGVVVAAVGVLDMLRYHLFTGGAAWIPEYGCASDPESLTYLRRYSPLHNVKDGAEYPATLIVTGANDTRVSPGVHSFKFTAALQHAQAGEAPVLLRVQTAGGHGAGAAKDDQMSERVDVFTFITRALNWNWSEPVTALGDHNTQTLPVSA